MDAQYNHLLLGLDLDNRRPPSLLDHLHRHPRDRQILDARLVLHPGLDRRILPPLRHPRQPLPLLQALPDVPLSLPDDLLLTVPNRDVGVVKARDIALDEEEVEARVDADDGEVLDGGACCAHVAGHFLAREDSSGVLEGRVSAKETAKVERVRT